MRASKDSTDLELLAFLKAGDDHLAFELIYRKYARALFCFIRKSINRQEDCEEMVQDLFVSLWERREQLGHLTALNAYLFTSVRYMIIRYMQHESVKLRYAEHFKLFEALYQVSPENPPEHSPVKSFIEKGLSSLPERCQQAVKLRLNQNLNNGDIAKAMNIKKRTVENYMVTAVNHLRSLDKRELFDG